MPIYIDQHRGKKRGPKPGSAMTAARACEIMSKKTGKTILPIPAYSEYLGISASGLHILVKKGKVPPPIVVAPGRKGFVVTKKRPVW